MPKPKAGENQKDFLQRCIPQVLDEGTATGNEQAVAICYSMWEAERGAVKECNMEDEQKMCGEPHLAKMSMATTFEELEAEEVAHEAMEDVVGLVQKFGTLATNALTLPEVDDKPGRLQSIADGFVQRVRALFGGGDMESKAAPMKTEGGTKYPAADYAYVPDPEQPSTWKLRLTETPGKVTTAQLGRAAAAFSPSGFRGEKVQIPAADVAAVKRRIRAEYEKLGVQRADVPQSVKETTLMVWKEANGRYRWLAIYSNKFRDNDNPPEILSEEAHRRFVKEVDAGDWPMPELWHWHTPGTRWGVADWLAYAGDGFAMASGLVDEGHEKEAEAIGAMQEPPLVSHGMPRNLVERDEHDKSIITRYVTREISDLPAWAAANKLTSFEMEAKQMSLPDEKKEYLRSAGLDDERIEQIETALADKAKQAADAGLDFKEEKEQDAPKAEPPAPNFATREEVAVELAKVVAGLSALGESVQALTKEVASLKEADEAKVATKAAQTPAASLEALIMQSVIGRSETQVDGRSALAKSGPKQAETEVRPQTGIPFIDAMLSAKPA